LSKELFFSDSGLPGDQTLRDFVSLILRYCPFANRLLHNDWREKKDSLLW